MRCSSAGDLGCRAAMEMGDTGPEFLCSMVSAPAPVLGPPDLEPTFFGLVYFSRGTLPTKKRNGERALGDLELVQMVSLQDNYRGMAPKHLKQAVFL